MIIFGSRTKREPVGYAWGTFCVGHQVDRSEQNLWGVLQKRSKFTLYFVPTFTYSKGTEYVCMTCGFQDDLGWKKVPVGAQVYRSPMEALAGRAMAELMEAEQREDAAALPETFDADALDPKHPLKALYLALKTMTPFVALERGMAPALQRLYFAGGDVYRALADDDEARTNEAAARMQVALYEVYDGHAGRLGSGPELDMVTATAALLSWAEANAPSRT